MAWLPRFQIGGSLAARYLMGAFVLLLALGATGVVGSYYLQSQRELRVERIQQRQEIQSARLRLQKAFWHATYQLEAFLLTPDPRYREQVTSKLTEMRTIIDAMGDSAWVHRHRERIDLASLDKKVRELQFQVSRLFAMHGGDKALFVAREPMQTMAPISDRFLRAGQIQEWTAGKGLPEEAMRRFRRLSHTFSRMRAELLLYVLGEIGVFGDPLEATASRGKNVDLFLKGVNRHLDQLEKLREQGRLTLEAEFQLEQLQAGLGKWKEHMARLRTQLRNRSWRNDVPLVVGKIHPVYRSVSEDLANLDTVLRESAAAEVGAMSQVARHLNRSVWLVLLLQLAFISLGYWYFRDRVLGRLDQVALALQREAIYRDGEVDLPSGPKELRKVVDALASLKREVASRERDLAYQATHDPLTGLGNRTALEQALESAVAGARAGGHRGALLMLDLDQFKEINDNFGHAVGDAVLKEVAERLRESVRESDSLARFGGDEFSVVLPETSVENAERVAAKLFARLWEPLKVFEDRAHIGGSIGIVIFPDQGGDADTLVRRGDVAMYTAKQQRTGYMVYREEHEPDSAERLTRVGEFLQALERDTLEVHFQPVYNGLDDLPCGAEALVRWTDSRMMAVPPPEIVSLAEHIGMEPRLNQRILNASVREAAQWHHNGNRLRIAVNLSAQSLHQPTLLEDVRTVLEAWDFPAEGLTLEVTEDAMVTDPFRAERVLRQLKDLGVRVAVDDYGTGYSSLSYLKGLPVDTLKIDKSFVLALPEDEQDAAIVASTIDLAHKLGLAVVAEGVETPDGMAFLQSSGCDFFQGFHLGRPQPAAAFSAEILGWPRSG